MTLFDELDDSTPEERTDRAARRGHRRAWWDFNLVVLLLVLFPLVYVRHLWNVHFSIVFLVAFFVVTGWARAGVASRIRSQELSGAREDARGIRPSRVLVVAGVPIAVYFATIVVGYLVIGSRVPPLFAFYVFYHDPVSPTIFVASAIGYAIVSEIRRESPKAARWAMLGFGLLMAAQLLMVVVTYVPLVPFRRGRGQAPYVFMMMGRALLLAPMCAGGMACLVRALCVKRGDDEGG